MSLTLQQVSDRIEIDDLLIRYTKAIDDKDWALLDTVFVPDADIDYTTSGGIAGKPAPKSIQKGQTLMFQVEPEGSVLRRTVIKARPGGGLDNSGTKEGFAKAVAMIPRDKNVVFSFEENPAAESGNGAPPYLLKMIQLRLTEEEAEARWNEMTQDP